MFLSDTATTAAAIFFLPPSRLSVVLYNICVDEIDLPAKVIAGIMRMSDAGDETEGIKSVIKYHICLHPKCSWKNKNAHIHLVIMGVNLEAGCVTYWLSVLAVVAPGIEPGSNL